MITRYLKNLFTTPDAPSECGSSCGCESPPNDLLQIETTDNTALNKSMGRRGALGMLFKGLGLAGATVQAHASPLSDDDQKEQKILEWEEYFKGNFRLMNEKDKACRDFTRAFRLGYRNAYKFMQECCN